jgi:glyoxylase-like metal-dependent hydrolase (beta-lactamase superfamily II)
LEVIRNPTTGPGGTWASQVAATSIRWEVLEFTSGPFKGYAQSLDLFQDGTVVLVPMPGHTPGSIGLFVTADSGTVYFFIGDVAWKAVAVEMGAPKFLAASVIVDRDRDQTLASVEKVRSVVSQYPELVVVPAHDGAVQDALGYFPSWVR